MYRICFGVTVCILVMVCALVPATNLLKCLFEKWVFLSNVYECALGQCCPLLSIYLLLISVKGFQRATSIKDLLIESKCETECKYTIQYNQETSIVLKSSGNPS